MCCGEAFWKRVVVFCLTFGLGVLVAGFFISAKLPQTVKPVVVPAVEENKNCVPVDKNLKYETLPLKEPQIPAVDPLSLPESEGKIACEKKSGKCYLMVDEETNKTDKKTEDKNKSSKNETKMPDNTAGRQYYDSSKNPAEVQDLLHKERCFETQAQ